MSDQNIVAGGAPFDAPVRAGNFVKEGLLVDEVLGRVPAVGAPKSAVGAYAPGGTISPGLPCHDKIWTCQRRAERSPARLTNC